MNSSVFGSAQTDIFLNLIQYDIFKWVFFITIGTYLFYVFLDINKYEIKRIFLEDKKFKNLKFLIYPLIVIAIYIYLLVTNSQGYLIIPCIISGILIISIIIYVFKPQKQTQEVETPKKKKKAKKDKNQPKPTKNSAKIDIKDIKSISSWENRDKS